MEDHSVYEYLKRRTTEELEEILTDCLQTDRYANSEDMIGDILHILEARAASCLASELVLQARQKLLRFVRGDV